MRDCPQPWTKQPAGFPCVAATPGFVRTKGVVVVDPPRKVEGVVEWGELLGDLEEPFSHRKVLQSSPWALGPWHCSVVRRVENEYIVQRRGRKIAMKRPWFPFALLSHILYSTTLPHRHLKGGRSGGVDDGFGVYSADIGLGYLAWRRIGNGDVMCASAKCSYIQPFQRGIEKMRGMCSLKLKDSVSTYQREEAKCNTSSGMLSKFRTSRNSVMKFLRWGVDGRR